MREGDERERRLVDEPGRTRLEFLLGAMAIQYLVDRGTQAEEQSITLSYCRKGYFGSFDWLNLLLHFRLASSATDSIHYYAGPVCNYLFLVNHLLFTLQSQTIIHCHRISLILSQRVSIRQLYCRGARRRVRKGWVVEGKSEGRAVGRFAALQSRSTSLETFV